MPGIKGYSIMMPDAHQGYGFSIGGVAAFSCKDGCISPGGIGFDINCGVRMVATNLTVDDVKPRIKELLDELYSAVPSGVGRESDNPLTETQLEQVLQQGAKFLVEQGIGTQEDLDFCEAHGCMDEADPSLVPRRAKSRGRKQLGTLGAGNHFFEIQIVDEIFDEETARTFGLTKKGQIVFMIHCGSRGLGHQVASDYLRRMEDENPELMETLPEKDLIYAPLDSQVAQDYYKAMCAAANFAFANRHTIANAAKAVFKKLFDTVEFRMVYDVSHNIAKRETHEIDGKQEEVMVHRKGATRAFGPGQEELPSVYQKTGQPVLIPGSMGTGSYVLVGTEESMRVSFGSTAHGAGRVMSRYQAKQTFDGFKVRDELEKNEIYLKAGSVKGVADEAPGVYKDVDEVVKVSHDARIGNLVVKVKPLGVIKG
jgi:tRNA-splicing ligase RtcB